MKKRSIIGLGALALSFFALASCGETSTSASDTTQNGTTTRDTVVETTTADTAKETTTKSDTAAETTTKDKVVETTTSESTTTTKEAEWPKAFNFTCNLIDGVVGTAKVTDNDGAQYNYISASTFNLYEFSDGITFEYENSNTYNVKAIALVDGVEKASGVMGNSTSKNHVAFSLLASDITGDVVVKFEQTIEAPVFNIAPEKNNSNISYSYKLTGSSVEDKTIDGDFQLEEGYENLG